MNRHFAIAIFIALAFLSCESQKKESPIKTVKFERSSLDEILDTIEFLDKNVERVIPEMEMNSIVRRQRQKIESALNIGSLENGFGGQQIRIKGVEYDNNWDRLFLFTKKDKWVGEVFFMRYAGEDGFIKIIDSLQYQKYSLGDPKSGWDNFEDSLSEFGIFSLPNYDKIEGYNPSEVTHDISYEIEIGKTNYYRIFSLPVIREGTLKFPEVKRFKNILSVIKSEFFIPNPIETK